MMEEGRAAITSTSSPSKSFIKQPFRISYIFALILAISQQAFAGDEYSDLNQWDPKLSDSIEFYEPITRKISDEVLSGYPDYALRTLYETELYIAFQRYLNELPENAKEEAIKQQLCWLNTVYAEHKEEGNYFKNGRLGEITAEKILTERIQERIKALTKS